VTAQLDHRNLKSPIPNTSAASWPYGSVIPVGPQGDDMRYIALIVLVLAVGVCGSSASLYQVNG